ncbi:MAG: hypothetical protein EOP05_07210, partial [Proteobacteria bacterium]
MAKSLDPKLFTSPHSLLPLVEESPQLWVDSSGMKFPVLAGVPLLTPNGRLALADLKSRALSLLAHYERNIADLKSALKASDLLDVTTARLAKTREIQIHHLEFLKDLFQPLKLNSKTSASPDADFGYRLPPGQGLQGYFPNLVRDWSSKHGENEAQLALVRRELGDSSLGVCVFVGSGGGRLAYDVHQLGQSTHTICCDIGLVFSLAAARLSKGETLKVAEFPIAPKDAASAPGAIRDCKAPAPAREGLSHVLADVYHLPFADHSVDTVITPWL